MKFYRFLLITLFLSFSNFSVSSQLKDYAYNYNDSKPVRENITSFTTEVLGDKIDVTSGSLNFSVTDLNLPGNFNIPVSVTRMLNGGEDWATGTREFSNWSLEIPHIKTNYLTEKNGDVRTSAWALGEYCSKKQNINPDFDTIVEGSWYFAFSKEYWIGEKLFISRNENYDILSNTKEERVLKNGWKIDCGEVDEKEVIIVTDDRGNKYTFSHKKIVRSIKDYNMSTTPQSSCQLPCEAPPVAQPIGDAPDAARLPMYYIFLMVTRIEDKFGNYVTYSYTDEKITISSSDQRTINIYLDSDKGRVASATDGTQTVKYEYDETEIITLNKVKFENDKEWVYTHNKSGIFWNYPLFNQTPSVSFKTDVCLAHSGDIPFIHITSPQGVQADFYVTGRCQTRSEVPKFRLPNPQQDQVEKYWIPLQYNVYSVTKKNITVGEHTYRWNYEYSSNLGAFSGDEIVQNQKVDEKYAVENYSLSDLSYTIEIEPNNTKKVYIFDRRFGETYLHLLLERILDSENTLLETKKYIYDFSESVGTNNRYHNIRVTEDELDTLPLQSPAAGKTKRQRIVKTTRMDSSQETIYKTDYSEFNEFNKAQLVRYYKPNSTTYKRIKTGFKHDLENNHLNQTQTVDVKSSDTADEFNILTNTFAAKKFNVDVQMVTKEASLGVEKKYYKTFSREGNVEHVEYNASLYSNAKEKREIEFTNYKRGVPQAINVPNRYNADKKLNRQTLVNNNGKVKETNDFNNVSSYYVYDSIGRLKAIDLENDVPSGVDWLDTLITWNDANNTRTLSRCVLDEHRTKCNGSTSFKTIEYFDPLYRLIKKEMSDELNDIKRYQHFSYNHNNQLTYKSFLTDSAIDNGLGTTTKYDALGRVKSVTTSGRGTIDYDYLQGNKIKVTDAENNVTTTTYQAFGEPSYEVATKIVSPEDITTDINVDVLGLVRSIAQTGLDKDGNSITLTENRYYNNAKQLCLVTRPDVGNTIYGRNALGEMTWSKAGVSNTACTTTKPTGAINYTYDNLGDLYKVDYPDDSGDVTYTRDNNGNVLTLEAGDVTHSYTYNNQNLLEDETLIISGQNALFTDYGYNALMQRSWMAYPDVSDILVRYNPNAFGEPTEARVYNDNEITHDFASNAKYYPNGMLKSFTYGNGVTHSLTLDPTSQLPEALIDTHTSGNVVSLTYAFDNNANVTSIIDGVNSDFSLTDLQYDRLDRLTNVYGNSGIGNSTIKYDGFGNITSYTSKDRSLEYTYNYTTNRLTKVTGVAGKYSSFGYDIKGNITNNGQFGLTFNDANQVKSANGFTYKYDGHNRRVYQSDNGGSYSVYTQDGTLIYREKGETITGNGVSYIYLGKKLIAKYGDVEPAASIDESRQHYRPYGETLADAKDDIGYTGHKFDKALGLSYMQARYYDPVIGRFYSNDPVGYLGHAEKGNPIHGFNRYAYANNNPYKYVDPDGKLPVVPLVVAGRCATNAACRGAVIKAGKKVADKIRGGGRKTKHTDNRHVDRNKYPDKSKFKKPNQMDKLSEKTVKKPDRVQDQGDRVRVEKDFKREIGTNGEKTNVTVIDKSSGKRVTQFPTKKEP
ncbi:RHS repeat domain-containing protein [Pseudoalteromonas piratica]|uniref:Teneurin-like YD-shell domain-containing protein n=1 Tax=Pseudoalteromonas piratica TaxID=1348114 RepID=A0A0A7EL64_9GAMM|nr:RHS repeat-associated core domain-containing protein [Pseudoalteromonas piratica]AIY67425.1 hypothetical protein OM33_20555 [Pseudoalteromonas piratica]